MCRFPDPENHKRYGQSNYFFCDIQIVFGFSLSKWLTSDASILYRPTLDSFRKGQAVLAVGCDGQKATSPKGPILIRKCWGET